MDEQLPYQVTAAGQLYDVLKNLPVAVLLDNVRSLYNVGSFFRTGDAAGIRKLYLSGITGSPPHKGIAKTALGAEETVEWERVEDAVALAGRLRGEGWEICAVETSLHAVDLFDWRPAFPVLMLFGSETEGLGRELAEQADRHVRIPMLGKKHSLNVSVAGGIVMYELLRKFRRDAERFHFPVEVAAFEAE